MMIPLSPELERLVEQDVAAGGYASVEEFVARAVTELHEREQRVAAEREVTQVKVEEGWASAQRGELVSEEEARAAVDRGLRRRFDVSDVA